MRRTSVLHLALACSLLLGANACMMNPPPRAGVVYVVQRPPQPRAEVIVARPGAEFVWVPGFWSWREREYVWIGGRWDRPTAGFRTWVPHRWVHDRHGWYLIEGHWR